MARLHQRHINSRKWFENNCLWSAVRERGRLLGKKIREIKELSAKPVILSTPE